MTHFLRNRGTIRLVAASLGRAVVATMSERSHDRRRLAAECLALARQAPDPRDRAFLLDMAQKWLRLAEIGREYRLHHLPTALGPELRAQFELSLELPSQMRALLTRIDHGGR